MNHSRLSILLCGALVLLSTIAGTPATRASGAPSGSSGAPSASAPGVEELRVPSGSVDAQLYAVSCWAVGSCVTGGTMSSDAKRSRGVISTEGHGVWGPLKVVGT